MSDKAAGRHRRNHLSPALVQAAKSELARPTQDIVRSLIGDADAILQAAKAEGSRSGALAAMREFRANLELLAKLTGELRPDSTTVQVLNLSTDPAWVDRRSRILAALRDFPEARVAVAAALLADETDSGPQTLRIGAGAAVAPWRPASSPGGPEEPIEAEYAEVDDV